MKYLLGKKWTQYPICSEKYRQNYDAIDWGTKPKKPFVVKKNSVLCLECNTEADATSKDFDSCKCGNVSAARSTEPVLKRCIGKGKARDTSDVL